MASLSRKSGFTAKKPVIVALAVTAMAQPGPARTAEQVAP